MLNFKDKRQFLIPTLFRNHCFKFDGCMHIAYSYTLYYYFIYFLDVNSNSKPGKSLAAQSQGGSNAGVANNGGGKRRDNKNLSRRGGGYGGPPSGGQQYGGEGSYGRQNRHGNNRGRRGGTNYGGNDSRQMSSQAGNRYSAVTEADEIEIGSVFKSGSKKQVTIDYFKTD